MSRPGPLLLPHQPLFETGSSDYAWLNDVVAVGSGYLAEGAVAYRVAQVLCARPSGVPCSARRAGAGDVRADVPCLGAIVTNAERGALGMVGIGLVVFRVLLAEIASLGHISGAVAGATAAARSSRSSRGDTIGGRGTHRLRSNMLLDRGDEDAPIGSRVQPGGGARRDQADRPLRDGHACAGGRDRARPRRARTIARERERFLAIGAPVAEPGQVRIGDSVAPWTSP
jgi:Protein of unknown function (DUF3237)